jgi:uracil-DNA glycosylase
VDSFERLVADLEAAHVGSTFNFLRDVDDELDVEGAPAKRRKNLLRYLEARSGAEIIALGEAAGYAGARWSGIAFTSEKTLVSWDDGYATTYRLSKVWTEQSATIVHGVLEELDAEEKVLLWNAVPTHPRLDGEPLTNRKPTAAEIAQGAVYARRLIKIVRPRAVVPIGRVAAGALCVRHPANGGAAKFAEGMREVLDGLS